MDRLRARESEIATAHCTNHAHHVPWIAWAIHYRRPADHQSATAAAALPTPMDQFSGIFGSTVRRNRAYWRIFIGWHYGGAIDANAAGEIQLPAIYSLGISTDVVRASQIGIEVLDRIVAWFSVHSRK